MQNKSISELLKSAVGNHQSGKISKAEKLYRKILKRQPGNSAAIHYLGVIANGHGDYVQAEKLIKQAIAISPDDPAPYINLGKTLTALDEVDEAIATYLTAVKKGPGIPHAHTSLADAYYLIDDTDNAEKHYKIALGIDQHYAPANNNLGNIYSARGDTVNSIRCFRLAINSFPGMAVAHDNLALALLQENKIYDALQSERRALQLEPENKKYWQSFIQIARHLKLAEIDPHFEVDLDRCFSIDDIDHQQLIPIIVLLLTSKTYTNEVFDLSESKRVALFKKAFLEKSLPEFYFKNWLLKAAETCLLDDINVEKTFTSLRHAALLEIDNINGGREIDLLCAIGQQAFITQYVYQQTDEESRLIATLLEKTRIKLSGKEKVKPEILAVLSCFTSLRRIDGMVTYTSKLDQKFADSIKRLLIRHVTNIVIETNIRRDIEQLTLTHNDTSLEVQKINEDHPYLFWETLYYEQPIPFSTVITRQFPHIKINATRFKQPEILVAGCGTGKKAVAMAKRHPDAKVLAMDLSTASLAYGCRLAKKLCLTNITFMQGDILALEAVDLKFDIIECGGVLHHLDDPNKGCAILADLLNDGCYMRIGLFSGLARQSVVEARSFIKSRGYGHSLEDIRQARKALLLNEEKPQLANMVGFSDFFVTAGCRYLLYPVPEHCFSIPEIEGMLESSNLEFLGFTFTDTSTLRRYRNRFPEDKTVTDLSKWHIFETENTNTFRSMYQFWVRK